MQQYTEEHAELLQLKATYGDMLVEDLLKWYHDGDLDAAKQALEENYQGEHNSLADYARYWLEETGAFTGMSQYIQQYFDYEAYGRDLELGGDIYTIQEGYDKVHVFVPN